MTQPSVASAARPQTGRTRADASMVIEASIDGFTIDRGLLADMWANSPLRRCQAPRAVALGCGRARADRLTAVRRSASGIFVPSDGPNGQGRVERTTKPRSTGSPRAAGPGA